MRILTGGVCALWGREDGAWSKCHKENESRGANDTPKRDAGSLRSSGSTNGDGEEKGMDEGTFNSGPIVRWM